MVSLRGSLPLAYRRLPRRELDTIAALDLDPDQVERFLGPIGDIITAVRRGPAHSTFEIMADGRPVGFYVVHPDARDNACWWLGWIAMDRRQQGHGYGRMAVLAAINGLRRLPLCRRVRLLVAPDNARARRLYESLGFRMAGRSPRSGELVLEAQLGGLEADAESFGLFAIAAQARRVFRHWRLRLTAGPHAAWVIGVERGPPAPAAMTRHLLINDPPPSCGGWTAALYCLTA